MNQSNQNLHAVVIGASLGGLLAARALSNHFARISIIERDILPTRAQHRKGVPQSNHAHALLSTGREALENLFPGITEALIGDGATMSGLDEVTFCFSGYTMPKTEAGLRALMVSRPMLEAAVRARVLALPNVQVIDNADVPGLLTSADCARVTGVRLTRRATEATAQMTAQMEEALTADLVVDASGRGTRALQWLEQVGYAPPPIETVQVDVNYTTRRFRWTPDMPKAIMVGATRTNLRAGVLLAQEGGECIVTLAGYLGERASVDLDGFFAFAAQLASPEMHDVLRRAEPLGDAQTARYPASTRRRFDKMARFPTGFLPFGDAICSFNPIYGQGMTVAALEAVALEKCLRQGFDRLSTLFLKRAITITETPWRTAVNNDLKLPQTQGKRTPMIRFVNWYVEKLHRAASHDPALLVAFQRVTNLVDAPQALLKPTVAWRVLRGNVTRRASTSDSAATAPALAPIGVK
jgi:2-polyprenyl-6-methoxyphenol hydroxylase-like FAD-dependent oxidoreductase